MQSSTQKDLLNNNNLKEFIIWASLFFVSLRKVSLRKISIMENPFKFGSLVDAPYFTDRVKELDYIVQFLKSENHLVLMSPRRFGKSSLVKRLLSKPSDHTYGSICKPCSAKKILRQSFWRNCSINSNLKRWSTIFVTSASFLLSIWILWQTSYQFHSNHQPTVEQQQ